MKIICIFSGWKSRQTSKTMTVHGIRQYVLLLNIRKANFLDRCGRVNVRAVDARIGKYCFNRLSSSETEIALEKALCS